MSGAAAEQNDNYLTQARTEPTPATPGDGAAPADELDTASGTPNEAGDLEAEGDGALATDDDAAAASDTDDGTPEGDDAGEEGFEKRFKDTQAELTEKSQALAETTKELEDFRAEYNQQIGAIAQAEEKVQDELLQAEHIATQLLAPIQAQLQRMGQMSVQGMPQEQYAQWQQQYQSLQAQAGHFNQIVQQARAKYAEVKQGADGRRKAHDDRVLNVLIPNFAEVKNDMVAHAKSLGWPDSTIYALRDPHILKLLNDSRVASIAPDTIEEISTTTQARRKTPTGSTSQPAPKSLAERMYGKK